MRLRGPDLNDPGSGHSPLTAERQRFTIARHTQESPESSVSTSPLVRAAGITGFEELATSLGVDVPTAVQRVGLTLKAVREPEAMISYFAVMQLLERAARESGCNDFGQRLSLCPGQGLPMLGPIAVLLEHVPTVGEALQLGSRYVFVQSPAIRFSIDPVAGDPRKVDLRLGIEMPHPPPHAQTMELSLGIVVRVLELLGQGKLRPLRVLLPHARLAALETYQRTYGCACEFEHPYGAVRLDAKVLAHPLPTEDPVLRQLAQSYLDTHFTRPDQAVADKVRSLIRQCLSTGLAAPAPVAGMLAVTVRTLQRRLLAEGTSFDTLKDEVRRAMFADFMARQPPPPLSQVAAMLDYGYQSALSRSCRRWFGVAPSEYTGQA